MREIYVWFDDSTKQEHDWNTHYKLLDKLGELESINIPNLSLILLQYEDVEPISKERIVVNTHGWNHYSENNELIGNVGRSIELYLTKLHLLK